MTVLPTLLAKEVLRQGNVSHASVIQSTGGDLHLEGVGRHIPQSDTVNKRTVRILLECILVLPYICNFLHYYRPQRSCGKVMFSVKNSVHRGLSARHPQANTPPRQTPPWADTPTPLDRPPRQTPPPPADGHCSGRSASYWNAFLFAPYDVSKCEIKCQQA